MRCQCGKVIILRAGSHNRWYESHCSRYCSIYYQDPSKYPEVRISNSKHHSGIFRRPDISVNCDLCAKSFILRNAEKEGNRHFCSRDCFLKLLRTRHGHRDWTVLKLIQYYGPISAAEIAKRYCTNQKVMTTSAAAQTLRVYRVRNIVEGVKTELEVPSKIIMIYQINSNLPLAKVVVEKLKVK